MVLVRGTRSFAARLGLIAALSLLPGVAGAAEPSESDRRAQAAGAYDRGVAEFDAARFAVAARSFLEADALLPNDDAISNALTAAERAGDRALVAEAAGRILGRDGSSPALVERARGALAATRDEPDAATTLEPAPAPAEPAAAPSQSRAEGEEAPASRPAPASETHTQAASARPLPPEAFYAGAGVTAVLTGLTVWSGIDALAARNRLPGTREDNDDVLSRAHRTDALLAGTLVVGALTAVAGLRWVDWEGSDKQVSVQARVGPRGAAVHVAGPIP
jgi:hypothetical protein